MRNLYGKGDFGRIHLQAFLCIYSSCLMWNYGNKAVYRMFKVEYNAL
jgi:hypothetical protein